MPELVFTKDIHAPTQAVFDLIADLPNYNRWLPPSNLYAAVTQYSELPIKKGTQYIDQGKMSRMVGAVREYEPPKLITFHQVTVLMVGSLDITIRYKLEAADNNTHLTRTVTIKPSGVYLLAEPFLVRSIQAEVERILEKMKAYLEK